MIEIGFLVLLVISLFFLLYFADMFVQNSVHVGLAYGISPFIIGFFLISLGTSLPELFLAIIAVLRDTSELVGGNVIGSNIANIGLVLGIAIIFAKQFTIKRRDLYQQSALAGIIFLFLVVMSANGVITRINAFLFLVLFIGVTYYLLQTQQATPKQETKSVTLKTYGLIILGSIGLYASSEVAVYSVNELVLTIAVFADASIIGLTVIAISTSLPELSVALSALKKNQYTLIVGNVLGSNMFNILLVFGIPALISPIILTTHVLFFAIPVLVVLTICMFLFMFTEKRLDTWEGWVLFAGFILFTLATLFL
ncbi:MAG: sodium:calcium antiporter [Candidatus Woesearchaeota archaeon]